MKELKSIRFKMLLLSIVVIILSTSGVFISLFPKISAEITSITQNYLIDSANDTGMVLEAIRTCQGLESALNLSTVEGTAAVINIKDMKTYYTYVADIKGKIVYHPTLSKIGQQVENSAINEILKDVQSNNFTRNDYISYDYKGISKTAAYYVNPEKEFIVISTVDTDEILSNLNKIRNFGIVIVACLCILYAVISFALVYRMLRPVKVINNAIADLSNMDFRTNSEIDALTAKEDELGTIAKSIKMFMHNIALLIANLKDDVDNLNVSVKKVVEETIQISDVTKQVECATMGVAQGATNQAQEATDATEAVVKVGTALDLLNADIDSLMTDAASVKEVNTNANEIMNILSLSSSKAKEAVEKLCKQTESTNESILNIQKAVDVITALASQTNLLSLNASIEAARAGDSGKGFAVVADEIKKLAEESEKSAKQIANIINDIINQSKESMIMMEEFSSVYVQQESSISNTQNVFLQIGSRVDSVLLSIDNTSEQMNSLNVSKNDIMDRIQNLSSITEENAANSEEAASSLVEITKAVTKLKDESDELHKTSDKLNKNINIIKL